MTKCKEPHETPGSPSLIRVVLCFGIIDGFLLFLNDQWRPDLIPMLFPLWTLLSGVITALYSRPNWRDAMRADKWSVTWIAALGAVAAGSFAAIALRMLGMTRLSLPEAETWLRITFVLLVALLVPVVEEFVFRGVILDRLLCSRSIVVSVLLTSIAAALFHTALIPALIEQALIGGLYVAGRRSLGASTVAHISMNVIALLPNPFLSFK